MDYSQLSAEDLENPSNDTTLHGADEGGAKKLGGAPMMLDIRPLQGYGKLLHYIRIEDIDYSLDNTLIMIQAPTYNVTIKGKHLQSIRTGLQHARIVSLEVGKNPQAADDAEITDIHITRFNDGEES